MKKLVNSGTCIEKREGDLLLTMAIDFQPMAPIEGVIQGQEDISNARTAEVVKFSRLLIHKLICISFILLGYAWNFCLLVSLTSFFSMSLDILTVVKLTWLYAMLLRCRLFRH